MKAPSFVPPCGTTAGAARFRRDVLLCGGAIALAAIVAYRNSFSDGFVFDDAGSIVQNASIRHLWSSLHPPAGGLTVSGRPVLNFSFALNYALGGMNVWGYHAVNLIIHLLAGLALFGIMRRTLDMKSGMGVPLAAAKPREDGPMSSGEHGRDSHATLIAFAVALLWTVHPLQTESVTYIVQRAESLMGLFYLLTLYCFIRGADETEGGSRKCRKRYCSEPAVSDACLPPSYFRLLSILFCLLGMATKEVMVSAPVIVLLYDRTFVSGTFREAWRRHGRVHLGLAATWLPLACLVIASGNRGGTAGIGVDVSWWGYVLTQFPAIIHYLRLSIWPYPLVLDYGTEGMGSGWRVAPYAILVAALVAGTVWAFGKSEVGRRKAEVRSRSLEIIPLPPSHFRLPTLSFLAAFFFAILAPTSLVTGTRQTLAEHRMYLALAPVLALAVWGIFRLCAKPRLSVSLCLVIGICFIGVTARRNSAYRDNLTLFADTVQKLPDNRYARNNLGNALVQANRAPEAVAQFEEALRLDPGYAEAHNDLGAALFQSGRIPEAIAHCEEALRLKPDYPDAHYNLALALAGSGRDAEAVTQYEEAVRLDPGFAQAHFSLGNAFLKMRRLPDAIAQFKGALEANPDLYEAHDDLGIALAMAGRMQEAMAQFEDAVRLKPDDASAHRNLSRVLQQLGRTQEAMAQFEEARQLDARH